MVSDPAAGSRGRDGRGAAAAGRGVGAGGASDGAVAAGAGAVHRTARPASPATGPPGARLLLVDRWATVVFVVVSVAAAAVPDPFELVAVPVDLALFLLGCATFLWAYAVAIGRSRYDQLSVGGAFFLAGDGVAPPAVVRVLRLTLVVQIVVAVAVAAARPFTALAFSVLVPMSGLGLMALWGAYHGRFPARDTPDEAPPPAQ